MKKLLFITVLLFTTALSFAQSHVRVSDYTRSNGTYVPGHYRTSQNYTRDDNWITKGNTNPYTGKAGTLPGGSNSSRYTRTNPTSTPPSYSTSSYSTPSYSTSSYSTPSYSTSSYSTSSYSTPSYSTPSYSTSSYSTSSYSTPSYSTSSYSTPSYSTSSYSTSSYSTLIYTGSRGGTYYINSNGNKSYISR